MKSTLLSLLSFLGKHASRALPVGVVVGLFFPVLAQYMQILLIPALLIPLTLSLVRIKSSHLLECVKQWRMVLFASFWILVISPLIVYGLLQFMSLPEPLARAAIITAAAPPVTACAAISIYLGLNAAAAVIIIVVTMLLVPLTLPPIVLYLAEIQIDVEMWQLSFRLASFIFGAFFLAALFKKILGQARIENHALVLDGVSVISISVFIIGVMHGVTGFFVQDPWFVLQVFIVSSMLVLSLYIIATLLFWRGGASTAMAIGLISGNCNMGLMYLILVDQVALDVLIFFAIGQIPMYFLPTILTPLVNRFIDR